MTTPRATKPHALVLDDDPLVARSTAHILKRTGFHVTIVVTGEDGLERIAFGERFDLVVSDVEMPRMDGEGFLRRARGHWPEVDLVFTFLTGAPDATRAARCGVPCFAKPIGAEFRAFVGDSVERWRDRCKA